ncbi:DUF6703 family protein [Phytohabitans rumicis]|uniref:Uncharacterized protein n=1 Tax=Phytohabitans rumicis TaxID=1076125 RepID=A0A6V8L746_9ACTN|nr:DUF6703 family protein [Phytohabitans rumicis]GFJ92084.1 hypothetical protein Prum_057260 [Phytohabitans rumicis]
MNSTRINPTTVFLVALAAVLVGLFAPGVIGGIVLLAIAAALIYLMSLTWSTQPPGRRIVRIVILTVLIATALLKIMS